MNSIALVILLSALLGMGGLSLGGRLAETHSEWSCWNCWFGGHHHHRSSERTASCHLKTLASAEADFRANDRDGSGKREFWRSDVAGLFTAIPKGGSAADAIKLIDISVAAADDRPVTDIARYARRSPKGGYLFRAIRKKGEPPVNAGGQFAFCAFPAAYATNGDNRWTYIIDEGNTLFKADLGDGARGIEVFPDDDEIRTQWSKLD